MKFGRTAVGTNILFVQAIQRIAATLFSGELRLEIRDWEIGDCCRADSGMAVMNAQGALSEVKERWRRAWRGIGAGRGDAVFAELVERYSEPHRAYHNLEHVRDCLRQLEWARPLLVHAAEVEVAAWFHDAIYDPRRDDNEEQSALWAERALLAAGVAGDVVARVADLIRLTTHVQEGLTGDGAVLCDADLAILGAAPKRFDGYEKQIREEYAWVPEVVYREKRGEVLAGFLRRPTIYHSRPFIERYEAQARANLEGILADRYGARRL
jgi:predicted metal-dependent HD superfamily phosphohydrolase